LAITVFWCAIVIALTFALTFGGRQYGRLSDMPAALAEYVGVFVLLVAAMSSVMIHAKRHVVLVASMWATVLVEHIISQEIVDGFKFVEHAADYASTAFRLGYGLVFLTLGLWFIVFILAAIDARNEHRGLKFTEKVRYVFARISKERD